MPRRGRGVHRRSMPRSNLCACALRTRANSFPFPHPIIAQSCQGSRKGALSIRSERVSIDPSVLQVELDELLLKVRGSGLCFRHRQFRWRATGFEELRIFLLAFRPEPVDVKELRQEAFDAAAPRRRGMKRCSLLSGSRNRNVPASNCAQSAANAFVDMQSTSTRECSSPSSIFGMLSPALSTHSSNHTFNRPCATAPPPPCPSRCG